MGALQFADQPGYAALLLRRTYADLMQPGALIPRSLSWLGATDAGWNASTHSWKFPSGAIVRFGYLDNALDILQYQSSEFQFIGFDELSQFREADYRFMFSRLRRAKGINVPLRMRSGSNPGGPGHEWVKRRFIENGRREGRVVIPARLADNPHLDRETYLQSLSQLDRVTRAQLEHGDWSVRVVSGSLFQRQWFRVVDAAPAGWRRVRAWDLAASLPTPENPDPDWTVGLLGTRDEQGIYYVENMVRLRGTPAQVEQAILNTAEQDGKLVEIRIPQDPGAAGKSEADRWVRALAGWTVRVEPVLKDKVVRAGPASSQAERSNVQLVRGQWNEAFLEELSDFPEGTHDDICDAFSDFIKALADLGPRATSAAREGSRNIGSQFPRYSRRLF